MAKKIILVGHTKGGVSKSTLATNLAVYFARLGRTLLIDTDKQVTAATWASWRAEQNCSCNPATIILFGDQVYKQGMNFAKEYDFIVIDSGGKDNAALRYALLLADVLLIPTTANSFETAALDDINIIINGAKINNEKLVTKVVLARVDRSRKLVPKHFIEFLQEHDLELCKTMIPQLEAFPRAQEKGLAVFETKDSDKAANAIISLCQEV